MEKKWTINVLEWGNLVNDLKTRAATTLVTKHAIPGEHCRYCKSRVYCPAFLKSASTALETVETDPEAVSFSPEVLAAEYEYLLRAEALIRSARKGFEELMTQNIESGKVVPGWIVGRGSGKRRWSADTETIRGISGLLGVNLLEEKPISISSARKNPETRAVIDTLMTKGEGAKKLLPFDESIINEVFNNE